MRTERGFTVVELSAAIALLAVVVAGLLGVLIHGQRLFEADVSRTRTNDQIRAAQRTIDREVRSGNVVADPASEVFAAADIAAGMSLRVYTQANAPTRDGTRCVQWRVTTTGLLQRREWAPDWQTNPSQLVGRWMTMAEGVRNRVQGNAVFSLPQANLLSVELEVNVDPDGSSGRAAELRFSVSARNVRMFPADKTCGPTIPDPTLQGPGGSKVPPY